MRFRHRYDQQSFGPAHRPLRRRDLTLSLGEFLEPHDHQLPFSMLGIVMGDPIHVPREAGPVELELYRKRVEAALNDVTAKAYALAGADMTRATPHPLRSRPLSDDPSFGLRLWW
jgi:hypothetical protein